MTVAQEPQARKSWPRRHKILTAFLALVGLIIVMAVAGGLDSGTTTSTGGGTSAGSGGGGASTTSKPGIGDPVRDGKFQFVVTSEHQDTSGKVTLRLRVTNIGNEAQTLDASDQYVTIRESSHRIHNPFTSGKLATLGQALSPPPGTRVLDLACGTGEMLCTWAREYQVTGTGIDISTVFIAAARARAIELGVADQVSFVHGDASGYVVGESADIASCIGATWIGGGVPGTVQLLRQSLRPGGLLLIGEPYWRQEPPDQATVEGCYAASKDDFLPLPELIERFGELGCDVVEMVLASQDSWDRYVAAQWLNIRRWLDGNPDDELAGEMRAELTTSPARYARYQREYLGWGVFALMNR